MKSLAEKFNERFAISGNGCWIWTGEKSKKGYGVVNHEGKARKAHRVSWELNVGEIPDGLFVCHHCDNPSCVRPDHLFLGTVQDNNADRTRKGRTVVSRGEKAWNAKLTAQSVSEIINKYNAGGCTQKQIAIEYGISDSYVCELVSRKYWTHLELPILGAGAKGDSHE